MNTLLWILQILLALDFLFIGVMHFIVPPGLPKPLRWMYDLSPVLHWMSGTAEILAAFGLILPGLTKIKPYLTPLAAAGLVLVMLGAVAWHASRGEFVNIGTNLILAGLAAFVAYGRWRLSPLAARAEQAEMEGAI